MVGKVAEPAEAPPPHCHSRLDRESPFTKRPGSKPGRFLFYSEKYAFSIFLLKRLPHPFGQFSIFGEFGSVLHFEIRV